MDSQHFPDDVQLRTRIVDLADVARGALQVAGRNLRSRGHAAFLDLPAYPVPVNGDPMRLFQVVSHLLDNAARHTASGGNVTLRVWAQGDEARLSVADDGRGIAPERLERLSMALQGMDRGRGGDGEGAGLLLVRHFVELHGGRVEAASAGVNKGSRFTVRLPAHLEPAS